MDKASEAANERANRINMHRSNRQRSHQGHRPQPTGSEDFYAKEGQAVDGMKLKNKASDLDMVFYQQHADSVKNATSQYYRFSNLDADADLDSSQATDQFYQTQKVDASIFKY